MNFLNSLMYQNYQRDNYTKFNLSIIPNLFQVNNLDL